VAAVNILVFAFRSPARRWCRRFRRVHSVGVPPVFPQRRAYQFLSLLGLFGWDGGGGKLCARDEVPCDSAFATTRRPVVAAASSKSDFETPGLGEVATNSLIE